MAKIVNAQEAAALIPDGATLALGCMGLAGWPEEVARAIEDRFIEKGHPRDLSIVQGSSAGDKKERGVTRLGHEGLMKRWMGAFIGFSPGVCRLITENKIEAHCIPQGIIVNLWREIAAGRPGFLTKVGLGTFIDPRIDGGRMNSCTKRDIYRILDIDGEDFLFIKSFPVDAAIIRGTTIDENGNLSMENEGLLMEQLQLAQAARNSGGIVIAQAEYLAEAGTLHPKEVKVPGILVDYIVQATDKAACWQTEDQYYEPAFSGALRVPAKAVPPLPLSAEKVIVRRAAMELFPGAVVNLGVGMAAGVASVASEEGVSSLMTLTTEGGAVGGVPAGGGDFGHAYNAEAIIEHGAMFDFYDGGGLDIAFLGLAQVDGLGNVNVSKFGDRPMGTGGFVNISQNAERVVFTGMFSAGGLKVDIQNGVLNIRREGRSAKFVKEVEQITFSGAYSCKISQRVLYVTERCVFELKDGRMTLTEIAPGINMQRDILDMMDFQPDISSNLKKMPDGIFRDVWNSLESVVRGSE